FIVDRKTAQTISKGPSARACRQRMSSCWDNQDGGLEAAILDRVRNSPVVKRSSADNVAGPKHTAETMTSKKCAGGGVGERRVCGEAASVKCCGVYTSENAGMSSE